MPASVHPRVCVALLGFLGGAACAEPWVEHRAVDDAFVIRYPAAPRREPATALLEGGAAVRHRLDVDDVTFSVQAETVSGTAAADARTAVNALVAALLRTPGRTQVSSAAAAVDGRLGRDLTLKDTDGHTYYHRVVVALPRAWVATVEGPARAAGRQVQRFHGSLQILSVATPRQPMTSPPTDAPTTSAPVAPPVSCTGTTREAPTPDGLGNGHTCVDGQGIPHGPYSATYADGKRMERGAHANGKRAGTWTRWRVDGTLASEADYVADLKEGRETIYDSHGEREEEGANRAGKRHGAWKSYGAGGVVTRESMFENGERHGRETVRDADGATREEGPYTRGKRSGEWTFFHRNGIKAATGRMDGTPVGTWQRWEEDGRRTNSLDYGDGTGEPRVLDDVPSCPAGAIRVEREYRQASEQYCERRLTRPYARTERHGPYTRFHLNGRPEVTGQYEAGQQAGTWRRYGADGQLLGEEVYRDGVLVTDIRDPERRARTTRRR